MSSTGDRLLPAIGLRLLSVGFFATMNALIKLADAGGADVVEELFFRQLIAAAMVAGLIASGPGLATVKTRRFPAHLLRACVGLTSMACLFTAVGLLPLAQATTLQFTVPIFATIMGALWLREPTGWRRWAAVATGFVGVLIVAQPGGGHGPAWGAGIGLLGALLTANIMILLRRIGKTERPATTVFWFSALSCVPLGLAYPFFAHAHPPLTWALLIGIGLFGGAGQLTMTGSLKYGAVSVVVPMDYASLLWATAYGWLLFGVLPSAATWLGAPLIIGSGLVIVWREHVRHRQETAAAVAEPSAA